MLTGERTSYESRAWEPTAAQHRAAYRFVQQFAIGRRVVEVGCGLGFGVRMLAEVAASLLAIDSSAEAIAATRESLKAPSVTLQVADAMALSPDSIRSDLIIAMQVIEHLPDAGQFVSVAAQATTPGGTFILSTPNARLSTGENPYHTKEYTATELEAMLRRSFPSVRLYGVQGRERARSYHARRRRMARALLRADFLRLRRALPQSVRRRVADVLGLVVKRRLMGRGAPAEPVDWDSEYTITASDVDEALDLIAVCRHEEPSP